MLAWKIAPALAAGNTVVLKPAEFTPLTALAFAEICREVGPAARRRQHRHRRRRDGRRDRRAPGVDKIAFTGSTEVGRIIRRATAGSGKKLSLELGGKSPFIVFEDADLDGAVEGVVDAIWFNQGAGLLRRLARCSSRRASPSAFSPSCERRMETLRVGDPLDKAVDMGAIVAPVQLERIRDLVAKGEAEGAHARAVLAARCRRRAASTRRRCSPTSSRPRPSPRSRSSGRCRGR